MNEFIKTAVNTAGSQKKLGELCGFTQQAVYKWLHGKAKIPPASCALIEQATKGAVSRKDLRPDDWMRIWPELADAEQKPTSDPETSPAGETDEKV
ncbi:hypothetical protein EN46_06775 [Citrobacter amalonaticus]